MGTSSLLSQYKCQQSAKEEIIRRKGQWFWLFSNSLLITICLVLTLLNKKRETVHELFHNKLKMSVK